MTLPTALFSLKFWWEKGWNKRGQNMASNIQEVLSLYCKEEVQYKWDLELSRRPGTAVTLPLHRQQVQYHHFINEHMDTNLLPLKETRKVSELSSKYLLKLFKLSYPPTIYRSKLF